VDVIETVVPESVELRDQLPHDGDGENPWRLFEIVDAGPGVEKPESGALHSTLRRR
jgi:hypothetical protein